MDTQTDRPSAGLTDTLLQAGRPIGRISGRQNDWQVQQQKPELVILRQVGQHALQRTGKVLAC